MTVTVMPSVVQTVVTPRVSMMVTDAGNSEMRLGASLRDRATLPSPLRGLDPSGGYPSRLRSLRSLRAPLARRLASLTAAAGPTRSAHRSTPSSARPPLPPRPGALRASPVRAPPPPPPAACCARLPAAPAAPPATQSPWRLPSAGFAGVDAPLAHAARLAVPDRPGRPWFSHPTHRWCTPATNANGCDGETVRGEQSQSIHAPACRNECDHFARTGLRGLPPRIQGVIWEAPSREAVRSSWR